MFSTNSCGGTDDQHKFYLSSPQQLATTATSDIASAISNCHSCCRAFAPRKHGGILFCNVPAASIFTVVRGRPFSVVFLARGFFVTVGSETTAPAEEAGD